MKTLDKAKKQKIYTICGFAADDNDPIYRRFLELGFSIGEKVKIVAMSLQKKVFLIQIRGYLLSVRANLLCKVQVKE